MSAGIKANNDGSAAIQVNGTDRVTLSSAGVMEVPAGIVADLTGAVTGNAATATQLSTASGSAPSYSARAWVNFNGTGTVAIRASGNVSSITDNGTGDYTVNFTTAMPDANYGFTLGYNNQNNAYPRVFALYNSAYTASSLRLKNSYTSSFGSTQTFEDADNFSVAIFR